MRWKTHLPVADLARWANGRSADVPETATPSRLRWHLAATREESVHVWSTAPLSACLAAALDAVSAIPSAEAVAGWWPAKSRIASIMMYGASSQRAAIAHRGWLTSGPYRLRNGPRSP
jgi:hypothetical protein